MTLNKMKYFPFIFFLLLACSSSDKSGASKTEDRLKGNTFTANGMEEITAIVAECEDGGDGVLSGAVAQSTITIEFITSRSYSLTIDGENAIGSWEALDNDSIEMDTSDDQILEVDYEISESGSGIALELSDAWIAANCTASN